VVSKEEAATAKEQPMGLRDQIKQRVKKIVNQFSGEHSEAAPEQIIHYEKGTKDENAEVVMARINRPKSRKNEDE